jgi:hypothetical protein
MAINKNIAGIAEFLESAFVGSVNRSKATGTGAIAFSQAVTETSRLASVTVHFDAAPTTSENFVITLNSGDGAAYDTVLFSFDPSSDSTTDLVYLPDGEVYLLAGDALDVSYTNTDGVTYGLQVTLLD